EHLDDLGRGRAAHNGVIDQNDALALNLALIDVVLELDAEVADLVGGLDEGAADIVITDDAKLEWQLALGGIADGGRHAGIGHRNHDIGGDMAFARELGTDPLARLVDADPVHHAVGAREVDILEHAQPLAHCLERPAAMEAGAVDHDQLAGLDVTLEIGADNVERAGLRRHDPRIAQPPQHQWPHAKRITYRDQPGLSQCRQRVSALDLTQRIDDAILDIVFEAGRDQ